MLRLIEDHEVETLRRWRNHPRVRAASFTTHEIRRAEHACWWAGIRDDPSRRVLIYEHAHTATGVVTFTGLGSAERSAHWGFYLDLAALERSKQLLNAWIGIERAAIGHAFDTLDLLVLRGELLAESMAVRRLHHRFGFVEVGAHHRNVDGVMREVVEMRLDRADAR
ncbi:hypothetical protein Misp01_06630 [Microtetraspora sp. NBRC 13810]|uniref:GNAT family N-acetyltransferase n=1 Tax=Microtetraspora sp. NBRC 13810 TaxID=3030990 RepID=UPI0024A5F4DF|nr:GNAT family N-acetyltransferase [Microtetraspora sp. NBRC 13810]GLW05533.1 hypothetical protein Misp01_06630 [Microtetraspora sp. NBRC 13810]